jgi:hypothetical protein
MLEELLLSRVVVVVSAQAETQMIDGRLFPQPLQDEEMEDEPLAGPQQAADKVLKSGGQAGAGDVAMDDQPLGEGGQEMEAQAEAKGCGQEGDREAAADSFVAALLQRQANLEGGAAAQEGTAIPFLLNCV